MTDYLKPPLQTSRKGQLFFMTVRSSPMSSTSSVSIIVNLASSEGKREVLKAAWSKKGRMNQDYTSKVKEQCASYRPLREQLGKKQVEVSYPSSSKAQSIQ